MKQPNVFWMVKDWKESWGADDMQYLLEQAKITGLFEFVFHDVPSNAFCDSDTLALGPRDMRRDVKAAELLHDLSSIDIEVDAHWVSAEADVHWDGSAFWLRVPEDQRGEITSISESKLKSQLLSILGQWVSEEDWLAIVESQEAS